MTVEPVEIAGDEARWPGPGGTILVSVPALADAVRDLSSGLVLALGRAGSGRLHLFSPDGAALATIEAPPGYTLSYLVRGPGPLHVVATGETPFEGWYDWYFAIDAQSGRLNRAGPAY